METPDRQAFCDTWAYVALADRGAQQAHLAAARVNRLLLQRHYRLMTTNYIVDEALTLIKRRIGHAGALQFLEDLDLAITAGLVRLEWITTDREREGRRLFREFADKPKLSFTDCTSFAVMDELGIRKAFTGDDHFERTDPKQFPFQCLVRERGGRFSVRMELLE